MLLLFLVWFFCFASFWRIQTIKIIGLTRISTDEINKIIWDQSDLSRWGIFKQNNIFLFNSNQVSEQIINKYNVAEINIKKVWPRTLDVKVSERPYAFVFKEGTKLYYSASDGYLIQQAISSDENLKNYFLLENNNSQTLINSYNRISISEEYLDFILNLNTALLTHYDLPVSEFIIDSEFNTAKVKFINGPEVYFNVKDAIDKQLDILLVVKNEKIKDNFSRTNYIDLRYGSRVFINPDFN